MKVDAPPTAQKSDESPAYGIACGMLAQDWKMLFPLYLFLIAPQVVATLVSADDARDALFFMLAGRIVDLIFLFLVGMNWLRRFSLKARAFSLKPLFPIVSVGSALWMLFMVPLAAQFAPVPEVLKLALLVLLIPAVMINLRLFFFFVPLLLGQRPSREASDFARTYTAHDPYLALKIILGPAALSLLITNLISSFSPDERSIVVNTLVDLSAGIFWLLTTYVATAHAFLQMPEAAWHANGLDPYRQARLTTLSMRGAAWFAKILSPKKTLALVLLSVLIWSGNFLRLSEMPPAPALVVDALDTQGHSLAITLSAKDGTYHFRGFRPIFFALAGPQRGIVSKWPERVALAGSAQDVRLGLPPSDAATLRLEFTTERSAEDLVKLEDLYLWYRNVKLQKLDMTKARITETKQSPPESDSAGR